MRKVCICTLNAEMVQGSANYLKQKLSAYTEIAETLNFSDAASFAEGVIRCAAEGSTIISAAPVSVFLKAKLRLIKSVSSKIVRNSSILTTMGASAPADPREKDLQAAIPENSSVILSPDGVFSGFITGNGENPVVFLPLDENLLRFMFVNGLGTAFSKLFAKPQPAAPQFMPPQKAQPAEQPAPKKSGVNKLRAHVEKVISSGKTVAISPVGCAKPLISAISTVEGCQNAFVADSALRDRLQNESMEEYVAQCAKISKENSGADLGIGISNIYNEKNGNGDFVLVCVADSVRAKAAKVYAKDGEDKKHLIVAAVIKLCEMLDELSAAGLVNPDLPVNQPKKWNRNSKIPMIIAAAVLAVAIIACVIFAFVLGGKDDGSTTVNYKGGYSDAGQSPDYESLTEEYPDYEDAYVNHGGSPLDPFENGMNGAIQITEPTTNGFGGYTTTSSTLFTAFTTAVQRITTTTAAAISNLSTTVSKITTTIKTSATTTKPTTATTTKPTTSTTTKPTTAKPASTKKPAQVSQGVTGSTAKGDATFENGSSGTFVFRVYGYGHGVGMSQDGAIRMAKDGHTYDQILTNYFIGTTVRIDESAPAKVKYGDDEIPLVEYLCRTAKPEIGPSAPKEALKAQIVCAYTYAKWYDFEVSTSRHAYEPKYEYQGTAIHEACLEVLGISSDTEAPKAPYVDYNGKAAFTCYFASAAGKTASASSVWGGNEDQYPYLKGGAKSPETVDTSTVEISAEDMKKLIMSYGNDNGHDIVLDSNPANWLKIIKHDSAYNSNIGYVTTMKVGNYEVNGNTFRCYVADYKLRSHCYTFEYVPAETQTTTKAETTTEASSTTASTTVSTTESTSQTA